MCWKPFDGKKKQQEQEKSDLNNARISVELHQIYDSANHIET